VKTVVNCRYSPLDLSCQLDGHHVANQLTLHAVQSASTGQWTKEEQQNAESLSVGGAEIGYMSADSRR
jgi:hypothetical protein